MIQGLKISTNPSTLKCEIVFESVNSRIINDLKVYWQSFSSEYEFDNGMVYLPLFAFKRSLINLFGFLRNNHIDLTFDSFTNEVIQTFYRDRQYFQSRNALVPLNEGELFNELKGSDFNRILKKEQIRDILLLLNKGHGANFSVPGAGKTTTLLAVNTILKRRKIVNKLVVVAPINAFISWENEVDEIFSRGKIRISRISKGHLTNYQKIKEENADILLINYEKFRKDVDVMRKFFIDNKVHFVLDESHRIKSGFNNLSYRNIIELSDISVRRDVMSGTPMPQYYADLLPQFEFIWPGEIIIETNDLDILDSDKLKRINNSINGLYVRTKKNELDLKAPIINYNFCELGPLQSELYQLIKSEYARILSGMDSSNRQYFRKMGRSVVRLLQASTNPMLLTTNDDYEDESDDLPEGLEVWDILDQFSKYEKPVKIESVIDKANEIIENNGKVVIWSTFIRNILLLKNLLSKHNPAIIYGAIGVGDDLDPTSREGQIRMFHKDDTCKLLIANPQACGEGISLHKVCHNAIYLDRNFNAAHYLQSMDRIHRLGLDKNIDTTIDIFVANDTIDVPLIKRLNTKVENMGLILDDYSLLELVYDPADIGEEDALDKYDVEILRSHIIGDHV